jgi:EmrB/QacA subfamily drug resistance transporter
VRTGPRTLDPDAQRADTERVQQAWRVLSVTSLGMTMAFLNASTLNVALPTLARQLDATASQASWFVLAYQLVNTALILPFGRLTDLLGRKTLYVAGLGVITLASLGSAFAPNAATLIVLRGLQGIGGAAVLANTTALLVDAFPERLLAMGLSLNATAAAASNVVGPVVGGALLSTLGWRSIFWFNVPIGVAGLWWAVRTLRVSTVPRERESFDIVGGLLSALALISLVLLLTQGNRVGWLSRSSGTLGCLCLTVVAALIIVERRVRHPLVDPVLFRDWQRSMAFAATTMMSVAQAAVGLLVALFLQSVQGDSPLEAGVWITPLAVGMMIASPCAGRLASHIDPRILSSTGFGITALGLFMLAIWLRAGSEHWFTAAALGVIGVGSGIFQAPNTASLMAEVPAARRGIASGVRSTLQSAGQLVSTAVCLAIVTATVAPAARGLVFAGRSVRSYPETSELLGGFRLAFLTMFLLCWIGIAASLLRGRRVVKRLS